MPTPLQSAIDAAATKSIAPFTEQANKLTRDVERSGLGLFRRVSLTELRRFLIPWSNENDHEALGNYPDVERMARDLVRIKPPQK